MNQVAAAPAASSAHMPMQQTRAVARAAADAACSDETATATAATTSTANTAVASDVASKATSAITTTTSTAPAVASSAAPTLDPAALLSTVASAVAKKKHAISYAADRVIGTGSFGVVYQATVVESGESVAIKKVLQDRRFKNRELQIMSLLAHPNVISLKHCFYSNANKNGEEQLYLNLVMDFVPSTLHRTLRDHAKASRLLSPTLTRLYIYQICRSIHYIHSLGVCHRDIKPQNLLLDPRTNEIRLCDFGSAKMLNPNEPNVSYICSRYYRAPELVFEATRYTNAIDIWSLGAVFGELMIGSPLFPGDSSVDQLIEIIKVLGSPSKSDILAMNSHSTHNFPAIQSSLEKVFRGRASTEALDLIAKMLQYDPKERIRPLDALAHPFFDQLREDAEANAQAATGGGAAAAGKKTPMPTSLFVFSEEEMRTMRERGTLEKIVPKRILDAREATTQMQTTQTQTEGK